MSLPQHFPLGRSLGSGSYGRVYLATINGNQYVIKVTTNTPYLESVNELDVMRRFSHPHLVNCYGVKKGKSLEMILPKALCDLRNYVLSYKPTADKLLELIYHVATGIAFLHQQDIAHLDLNYNNILVFREGDRDIAKVSDFGLSMYCPDKILSRRRLITSSHRAPESFLVQDGKYTYSKANDIWALGMTILRCFKPRNKPYNGNIKNLISKLNKGLVKNFLGEGPLCSLVEEMLSVEPSARPKIQQVVERLGEIVGLTPPEGKVNTLPYPDKTRCIEDYRAIDRISYCGYRLRLESGIVFSAIDLYHRTEGCPMIRALVCLGLALKSRGLEADYLAMIPHFGISVSQEKIFEVEFELIKQCKGCLNNSTLWHRIPPGMEVQAYEFLRDVNYYKLAIDSYPYVGDRTDSFYHLYPQTQYWKYMAYCNHIDEDKISALYQLESG